MIQLDSGILGSLRVQGLSKKIDGFTLEADFSIQVGERMALSGRSGAGKTTLLRILAGLDELDLSRDRGKIFLGTQEVTGLSPQKRDMGFVFQDQALFPLLNVMDNLTFGFRMRGASKAEREFQAMDGLKRVGLESKALASVENLSGGEKQRVAFLRAILWKPKLLLLDEPFSALDGELRDVLRKELVELHRLWPAPLLLVTHDEADILAVATSRLQLKWNESNSVRRIERMEKE